MYHHHWHASDYWTCGFMLFVMTLSAVLSLISHPDLFAIVISWFWTFEEDEPARVNTAATRKDEVQTQKRDEGEPDSHHAGSGVGRESSDHAQVDHETGEVVATCVRELAGELDRRELELKGVREHLDAALRARQQEHDRLTGVVEKLRRLEALTSTVDVPAGRLHVVGRLIRSKDAGGFLAVVAQGRPIRMGVAPGWEFAAQTGDAVAAEAILGPHGWKAWRVNVIQGDEAAALPVHTRRPCRSTG